MILLTLLLTASLDMSRPEFQPIPDASGNYIIAEMDDVSGSFVVEELSDVPDSLSTSAFVSEVEYGSGEIIYNRDGSVVVNYSTLPNVQFNWNVSSISSGSSSARYIPLTAGYTYSITSTGTGAYYIGYTLDVPIPLTYLGEGNMTYYCPNDCYIFTTKGSSQFYVTYNPNDISGNDPDEPSGNDPDNPSGVDFDDSRLLVALGSITAQLSVLELLLLFNCLFPLTRKSVHKLMNRKED